ncbi:Peroxiredoxin Q [Actinoplanes sp. SE50]|uniref:redoxin domain-containing protein n=1 Tax=unclassified Actinoplanes TaxID=2626549 RepID=UPI00023ED637|nr:MULTISPECIES: redoxin domain-containing protein [unclassified Actinoplanes]AEV85653.1 Peroxiredoxin Q [Actinoplanes sp. SE50/110]ATO84046.1 Peroxiredoxin Q [Actinoplanes sp. SE50]SLM01456.1 Peroxiredoxin Q [Actinoplanes sp. SE50/110]
MTTTVRRRTDDQQFRLQLESNAIWNRMVTPGDRLPDMPLLEVDLGPIHLNRLRDTGPVVLLFFRHASSPECDAALHTYRDALVPALTPLDAHLVAVSPQEPGRLEAVKRRHELDFFVTADPRHTLIDAFNIGFRSPDAQPILGTGRSVLPFAATVVADRTGVIRFAEINADWSTPTAPHRIIEALRPPLTTR